MDTAALSALENAENTYSLVGINAVWEALKAEKQIDKLLIDKELNQDSIAALLGAARRLRVKLEFVPRTKLDVISQGGRHQGVIAYLPSVEYVQLDDILSKAQAQQESAILMVLDQIQDPHNLGAIIRSAECAGACGVVITEHSSVGLTPAVTSSSAGAIAHIPICKVINLAQAIEQMQEKGFWVLGADSEGEACYSTDMRGDTAIVIGNEGSGLRKLVRERCDALVGIPMVGQVRSLNASVAAGVLLFEAVRQQRSNQT